jgi:hypothetical protein
MRIAIGFLKTLSEACEKTGWQVHAHCLMPVSRYLGKTDLDVRPGLRSDQIVVNEKLQRYRVQENGVG